MRWERLFADLDAQLAAELAAASEAELTERIRHETGQHSLVDRLRAAQGDEVAVGLVPARTLRGQVRDAGPDWLLLADLSQAGETLVALAAVLWVEGLPRQLLPPVSGRVWAGLDLRLALRGLARERSAVLLHLRDGVPLTGTVDRVYADHVDVALHAGDEPRRAGAVTAVRCVPLAAVTSIRRLG